MKRISVVIISCLLVSTLVVAQSMGINNTTPHSSSVLDVKSDTKGLLIPRLTTIQRKAVAGPATGLLVFDMDKSTIYFFDGQNWQPMLFATSEINMPPIGRAASDGLAADKFGTSVSISGNYAIVGASLDDITTKTDQGSAYIFTKVNGSWVEQAKLIAPDGVANDHFGNSVSISGDYAIVGAPNGTGDWFLQGAAYIFFRTGTNWTLQAKIIASDGLIGDYFGTSVCINGDYIIAGAPNDANTFANQGSAYIFMRSGTSWLQQSKLIISYGEYNDQFGFSVSIDGNSAIVGAPFRDANAFVPDMGAAYVFLRTGTTWALQSDLYWTTGDPNDIFGYSVSISGNYAVVGAPNTSDPSFTNNGAVFIFTRSGTTWSQPFKLTATDPETQAFYGNSIHINGTNLIVGAYHDNVGSTPLQGSTYIYRRTGISWPLYRKLDDGNGQALGLFGSAVAVSGFNYIVSAVGKNGEKGEVNFLNIE